MTQDPDQLAVIRRLASESVAGLDFAHGVEHLERVARLALRIARDEGGDTFLVEAGAWLHQLHDDLAAADAVLARVPLPPPVRTALREIVRDCRPQRISRASRLEARIVFDADALEVLGPRGTVRELLCNFGARGLGWPESVRATRAVQELFAEKLATVTGRRLAEAPLAAMQRFWELYDGWEALDL